MQLHDGCQKSDVAFIQIPIGLFWPSGWLEVGIFRLLSISRQQYDNPCTYLIYVYSKYDQQKPLRSLWDRSGRPMVPDVLAVRQFPDGVPEVSVGHVTGWSFETWQWQLMIHTRNAMWQQAWRGGSQTTVYCYLHWHYLLLCKECLKWNTHAFQYLQFCHGFEMWEASCEFRLWCQMMPLEWSNSASMTDHGGPGDGQLTMMVGMRSLPYFNRIFLNISSF